MMRCLRPVLLAIVVMLATVPVTFASSQWCEVDPLLVITTPAGGSVPVHVTTAANGVEHVTALTAAQLSYSATSIANGSQTLVTVTDFVANDGSGSAFVIKGTVSTGPFATGTVLATTAGTSGHPIYLTFVLNQP